MSQTKPPVPPISSLPDIYKDNCRALGFCVDEIRRICGDTNVEFTVSERSERLNRVKKIMNTCANNIIDALSTGGLNNVQQIEDIEFTPFPVT